jgi:hypothetical protein
MATSSEELSSQADQLKELIQFFNTGKEQVFKSRGKKKLIENKLAYAMAPPISTGKAKKTVNLNIDDEDHFENY